MKFPQLGRRFGTRGLAAHEEKRTSSVSQGISRTACTAASGDEIM